MTKQQALAFYTREAAILRRIENERKLFEITLNAAEQWHLGSSTAAGNALFNLISEVDRMELHYKLNGFDLHSVKPMAWWEALHTQPSNALQWNAHNGFNEPRRA